jgi:uroporphyrinogen decarboxylase
MIDAGIEIFNPVQTNCADMDFRRLKKEFGGSCTFWGGGIETAGTLNTGSPEQVRQQVLERLEVLSENGGFIFNTVHNILPEVPPRNIVAMFDAVKEFNSR